MASILIIGQTHSGSSALASELRQLGHVTTRVQSVPDALRFLGIAEADYILLDRADLGRDVPQALGALRCTEIPQPQQLALLSNRLTGQDSQCLESANRLDDLL